MKKLTNKRLISYLVDHKHIDMVSVSKTQIVCTVSARFRPEELPQLAAIEKFIKKPLPLSDFPRLDYSDWKVSAPTKPQNKNRRPGPRRNGPAGFKRSDGKPSVRRRTARGQ